MLPTILIYSLFESLFLPGDFSCQIAIAKARWPGRSYWACGQCKVNVAPLPVLDSSEMLPPAF